MESSPRALMKVHKINRYRVGAGLAGKVLAIHLDLVSRHSRPQRTKNKR
jgi:hypothetical protein